MDVIIGLLLLDVTESSSVFVSLEEVSGDGGIQLRIFFVGIVRIGST